MAKLSQIKDFFKNTIAAQINDFKSNRFRYLLKVMCWVSFFSLLLCLQTLTMLENLHLIPVGLTVILGILIFLYSLLYGKFYFCTLYVFYFLFLLFGFISTILGSKDFSTFFVTQIKLTTLSFIVFTFCVNFYKPKAFMNLLIIMSAAIAILFLFTSFKDIFNFTSASEERIGNKFFGNVNYLGGALGSGVFFISIYVSYYKKHIFKLSLFALMLLFLILRTGSRMPFIISIISIFASLFFLLWQKHKLVLFMLLGAIVLGIALLLTIPQFSSFSKRFLAIFEALFSEGTTEGSLNQRTAMQVVGYQFWLKKLFLGYGSSGFAQISSFGTYSHATLPEILCDFGLIGAFLFYYPLIRNTVFSKKGTLSYYCFLIFAIAQLIPMSLMGMLIYEKRFYVYIAMFVAIFLNDNKQKEFYIIIERENKYRPVLSNNFPLFKNKTKIKNVFSKTKTFKHALYLFIIGVFGYSSAFLIGSQDNLAAREVVASSISNLSNLSLTKSLNLNITSSEIGVARGYVDSVATKCYQLTNYKTSVDMYNFRVIYDNFDKTLFDMDFDSSFNPTVFIHSSSGTHKNEKDENVFNWFEVKTMFEGNAIKNEDYANMTTFIEIREKHAKILLDQLGLEYTMDNCELLLKNDFFLYGKTFLGGAETDVKLRINNIVLENEGNDKQYEETYGDYILMYPLGLKSYDGFSVSFDFGTSFPETLSYLDFINKEYERENFEYSINNYTFSKKIEDNLNFKCVNDWCLKGFKTRENVPIYLLLTLATLTATLILQIWFSFKERGTLRNDYRAFSFFVGAVCCSFTLVYFAFKMLSLTFLSLFVSAFYTLNIIITGIFTVCSIVAIYLIKSWHNEDCKHVPEKDDDTFTIYI